MKTEGSKERYRKICQEYADIPLFQRDWWLDAVCGKEGWGVALAGDEHNVWGALPYRIRPWVGVTVLDMPKLTQTLGVWIRYPSQQKYASRLSHEKSVCRELIGKLPSFDFFRQYFHYSFTNWLPFYWAGFEQMTRYTYVIHPLDDLERVAGEFESSVRNKIRKARDQVEVVRDVSARKTYELVEKTFERQDEEVPYSLDFFERIVEATKGRSRSETFGAIDETGRIHSSLFLMWDDRSSYLHVLGEDPELRQSGAGILLAWEAIKYTKEVVGLDCFDFVGSIIESVERVRRSFGARQKRYFCITKASPRMRFLMGGRRVLRSLLPS